jgi:hypothetical protein
MPEATPCTSVDDTPPLRSSNRRRPQPVTVHAQPSVGVVERAHTQSQASNMPCVDHASRFATSTSVARQDTPPLRVGAALSQVVSSRRTQVRHQQCWHLLHNQDISPLANTCAVIHSDANRQVNRQSQSTTSIDHVNRHYTDNSSRRHRGGHTHCIDSFTHVSQDSAGRVAHGGEHPTLAVQRSTTEHPSARGALPTHEGT